MVYMLKIENFGLGFKTSFFFLFFFFSVDQDQMWGLPNPTIITANCNQISSWLVVELVRPANLIWFLEPWLEQPSFFLVSKIHKILLSIIWCFLVEGTTPTIKFDDNVIT